MDRHAARRSSSLGPLRFGGLPGAALGALADFFGRSGGGAGGSSSSSESPQRFFSAGAAAGADGRAGTFGLSAAFLGALADFFAGAATGGSSFFADPEPWRVESAYDLWRRRDAVREVAEWCGARTLRTSSRRGFSAAEQNENYSLDNHRSMARDRARVLLGAMKDLDGELAPYLYDEGHTFNKHWGYLTRASHNDKSHLQRQIEKYADIYCAKVTDLYKYTPYHYFRAAPQILAHESDHAHD